MCDGIIKKTRQMRYNSRDSFSENTIKVSGGRWNSNCSLYLHSHAEFCIKFVGPGEPENCLLWFREVFKQEIHANEINLLRGYYGVTSHSQTQRVHVLKYLFSIQTGASRFYFKTFICAVQSNLPGENSTRKWTSFSKPAHLINYLLSTALETHIS